MKSAKIQFAILLFAAPLMLTSCQQEPEADKQPATDLVEVPDPVETAFTEMTQTLLAARPLTASMFGVAEQDARGYYNNRVDDYSPAAEAAMRNRIRAAGAALEELQADTRQGEDNRKVMANLADYYSGDPAFPIGYIDTWMGHSPFVVNQINGPAIDAPGVILNNHAIDNGRDAEDYIARLVALESMLGGLESKVKADQALGWVPPKVVIQGAVNFLDGFTKSAPAEHAFITNFVTKLEALELADDEHKALVNKATQVVKESVYPAYESLEQVMRNLKSDGRDESGIWAQPKGAEFYREAVRKLGDTTLTPEEIHQVGLAEVTRITTEMDAILDANGYTDGSVGERMAALNQEPRFLYEDSDEGRAQLLADLNGQIEEINALMPQQFATKPPYDVEVRRIPVERQDGAPGGQYTPPTLDGSQPGVYWINLRDMKANPKFDLKTLTYHEANPGHHWQIALNLAQENLPLLRRTAPYNAYVEGWALYSELVAWEMGLYEDDPFGDLGRLKAELFRAVRLVVDTGLHHKRWTREQAIEYMADTTGTAQSDVVAEIERYMTWPGQALGYKMGMLNIVEQRDIARQALGEDFDIKEFHDLILLGGAVPMTVLNEKIADWITSKKS